VSEPVRVCCLDAGYTAKPVLRRVEFRARHGECVAVLGPNGGGKTTLFRVLLGELPPMHGTVDVAPCAVVAQTDRTRLDFPVSALDVALMGTVPGLRWWRRPGRIERARALAALEAVGMAGHAEATFGALSGGQRQRVLVARALVQDTQVLLLDEPFTGLDRTSADRLEALLRELLAEGRTLLLATHDVEQAMRCDAALCLNREQIAFGSPREVLTREALERTYGAAIVRVAGFGPAIVPPHHHEEPV